MECLAIPTTSKAADAMAWAFHMIAQAWPQAGAWRTTEPPWHSLAKAYSGLGFKVCPDRLGAEAAQAGAPIPYLTVWYDHQQIMICASADDEALKQLLRQPGWKHLAKPCQADAPAEELEGEACE